MYNHQNSDNKQNHAFKKKQINHKYKRYLDAIICEGQHIEETH